MISHIHCMLRIDKLEDKIKDLERKLAIAERVCELACEVIPNPQDCDPCLPIPKEKCKKVLDPNYNDCNKCRLEMFKQQAKQELERETTND